MADTAALYFPAAMVTGCWSRCEIDEVIDNHSSIGMAAMVTGC